MSTQLHTQAKTTSTPPPSFTPVRTGLLQRTCACGGVPGIDGECPECRRKRLSLQRRAANTDEPATAPPIVRDMLHSPGQPLDAVTRTFMEPRLGYDFSPVRVHTDARAAESARSVNALAYTVGRNVVFGRGQYAPGTYEGKRLLAHELTHVVQQRGSDGMAQQSPPVSQVGDPAEMEAETVAHRIATGLPAHAITPLPTATVQRDRADEEDQPMSRKDEIKLSLTSPGEVTGSVRPPIISLYNFAINRADLKTRHGEALAELGDLIKRAKSDVLRVLVVGHADATGEAAINNPLSRNRAQAAQRVLNRLAGATIEAAWAGANQPVASNNTVEGRSRNRRIDIHFLPTPTIKKKEEEKKKKEEEEDDTWFCLEHPIICIAIGLGAAALWFCLLNPLRCLPGGPTPPGGEEKEKKPKKRACPTSVALPGGEHRASLVGPVLGDQYWLKSPFKMHLTFQNDASGCDCSCGEYLQEVRGYAERDRGTGQMRRDRRIQLVGGYLDETIYHEDARAQNPSLPYGHRYFDDGTFILPRPNQDEDSFLPNRETGCNYEGADEPGMISRTSGEHLRFRFEFRARPVDRCDGRSAIGTWSTWVVWGDETLPPPTTLPTVHLPSNIRAASTPREMAADRIPPRVNTPVPVTTNGWKDTMPAITLSIEGNGGHNGTVNIDGHQTRNLQASGTVQLSGVHQTAVGSGGNLKLVAHLGKTKLASTDPFSVSAIPQDASFTFNALLTGPDRGIVVNVDFQSDSGIVADLDETKFSEVVEITRNTGCFLHIRQVSSGYMTAHRRPLTDTHSSSTAALTSAGEREVHQTHMFLDKRAGALDIPMRKSGFIITRKVTPKGPATSNYPAFQITTAKHGAATTAHGIDSAAGSGSVTKTQDV